MAKQVQKQFIILFTLSLTILFTFNSSAADHYPTCIESNYNPEEVVFLDEENKVCFIDLMAIDVTVSQITITDQVGKKMDQLDCLNLNMKEIVEFDMVSYATGTYNIYFETIGGSFTKSITLK